MFSRQRNPRAFDVCTPVLLVECSVHIGADTASNTQLFDDVTALDTIPAPADRAARHSGMAPRTPPSVGPTPP